MKLSRLSFALIVFSIACAGYVSFRLIGDSSISPKSDEVIYFRIIQEMFDSGDLMVPSHGDTPFFGKPPLKFWLTMPFLSAFGESNFGYRFLDGLIGFFSLVLTAFVGAKISRSWYVGSLAVLILVTVKPFVLEEHGLRRGTLDNLLVLCCIAALYFLWLVYEGKLDSKTRYFSIAGVFTGLAILTKSYAGFFPVIAFAPIGFWLLVNNKARQKSLRLFCVDLLAFALPALAIPTLYYFPLFFMHPQAWDYAFVSEIGYRVLDHAERVEAPHLYLKKLFAENFVSHSWILIAALVYQAYSAMKINSLAARFLLSWGLMPLMVYSIMPSKLIWYIAPCVPAYSIICASFLCLLGKFAFVHKGTLKNSVLRLLACAGLIFGLVELTEDGYYVARAIEAEDNERLPLDQIVHAANNVEHQCDTPYFIIDTSWNLAPNPRNGAFNTEAIYWRMLEPFDTNAKKQVQLIDRLKRGESALLIGSKKSVFPFLSKAKLHSYIVALPFQVRKRSVFAALLNSECDLVGFKNPKRIYDFGKLKTEPLYGFSPPSHNGAVDVRFNDGPRAALFVESDSLLSSFIASLKVNMAYINPYHSGALKVGVYLNETRLDILSPKSNLLDTYELELPSEVWNSESNVLKFTFSFPDGSPLPDRHVAMFNWITITPKYNALSQEPREK